MGNRVQLNRPQRQKYPKKITGHTFSYAKLNQTWVCFFIFLGRFLLLFFCILYIFFPCEFQGIPRDWTEHKEKDDFR